MDDEIIGQRLRALIYDLFLNGRLTPEKDVPDSVLEAWAETHGYVRAESALNLDFPLSSIFIAKEKANAT